MQPLSPATEPRRLGKEFSFPSDVDSMTQARDSVIEFVKPYFGSEVEEIDVLIALQEALANAVVHGCRNDPSKIISCSVKVDRSAITITIRDPGPGFDVDAVTQSSEAGTNMTDHGRGIALMRSVMDEVAYRNGGSEVRLRKLRAVASP